MTAMNGFTHPLRFEPFFQDYLWGGRNLARQLGKPLPSDGVWAESWEIVDHPQHQSVVASGDFAGQTIDELIRNAPEQILGKRGQASDRLPLLLKYLDCQKVLSVQVHPADAYAQRMTPPDLGKTEAWYIVDCEPDAVVYAGLQAGVTREDLITALELGQVDKCLHQIRPQAGDCIFVPAGTVHALGAGLLVAEIQQASNTTFRLFDWNRLGADGRPRPLHIDQSLEVIDFQAGPRTIQAPLDIGNDGRQRLVQCQKFNLDRFLGSRVHQEWVPLAGDGRFHLLTAPQGDVEIENQQFKERLCRGESLLLPAAVSNCRIRLSESAVLLDMYVPDVVPDVA
jgi:mannose-6-phosphate isomerase